ncbi:hypothetical protein M413DRAFT_446160 [Hebeloma cylindrosporum]|uniref:Zn(2)-C6 fungal-type domain-containing protein n=1 Tax=Hebeloma cylindrosporum TaxID=76867 RepID=A0A0C2YI95_HEBCY|nr:hypothetical protein M413DRAFT_446160 [Hebeloma cylindrosporum h7]
MSSSEEEYNGDTSAGLLLKKRRMWRACDICRKKKIRCDGVQLAGSPCSNCISNRFDCTYVGEAKKRAPKGYVDSLENKIEKLEKLEKWVRRLCPDEAVYKKLTASLDSKWTVEGPPVDPSALVGDIASNDKPNAAILETVTSSILAATDKADASRSEPHTDEDDPTLILAENLRRMALIPDDLRFVGKSSWRMFLETAIEMRRECTGDAGTFNEPGLKNKRMEFWDIRPWERKSAATSSPKYNLPDPDLALHCIDLYFLHSNLYLPVLHRPTFERCVKEGLHFADDNFTSVFLLVCAIGARHSDNPLVRLDGVDSHISAGWKWFEQVQIMKRSVLAPLRLYDLQIYCLGILYLQGTSAPQSCWTLAGIGIRLAQDVGAHRRKPHNHTLTPDDELWKRAFWVIVCCDRICSSTLGLPCAIHDEDFDLDLPVDCDDEYWEHPDPEKRFKQPPNKPSLVTSFILTIKLHRVLAFALRTMYAINKSKILLGFVGEEPEQRIVAELDSALNKWVDSVPDSLRWDPNREDEHFFNQSVFLFASYYHIQIIIHRPFIPSPTKPASLSFPSLTICANAARSCTHIVDVHRERNSKSLPFTQLCVFTSAVVLLLSIWGGKLSGLLIDPNKEMVDVHKCMKVLKASEVRWNHAGRLWDVLYELAGVGEPPSTQPSPPSMKRDREWDSPPASVSEERPVSQNDISVRIIAGSRRVGKEPSSVNQTQGLLLPQHQQSHATPPLSSTMSQAHIPSQQEPSRNSFYGQVRPNESQQSTSAPFNTAEPPTFALPVYSSDLGRLPLYGQMTFGAQAQPIHPPQLHPGSSYRYTASEPMAHASASGPSSSYEPHLAPAPQQQPYPHHHNPQGISAGYPPESSSMALGPYGTDATAGMLFDAMLGKGGYSHQRTPTYGSGPMHLSFSGVGWGSMLTTPPQLSSAPSAENMDRGVRMVTIPDRSSVYYQQQQHQSQHQWVTPQEGQQASSYPLVPDSDAQTMWSNSSTPAFKSDERSTFLSNFGELSQGNVQDRSGGQFSRQVQHQRVAQQHEQPLAYPLVINIDSDIQPNATKFELDRGPSL